MKTTYITEIKMICHCESCGKWYTQDTISTKDRCPNCGEIYTFWANPSWLLEKDRKEMEEEN